MKLLRWGEEGGEKPGVVWKGKAVDVSGFGEDYGEEFFETKGIERLRTWLEKYPTRGKSIPASSRFGPCILRPSKIVCIGLNYSDHAAESGMKLPEEPVLFFKSTTALCGPNDDLVIPKNSIKTDWEVELALVIGKRTKEVTVGEALESVAGYCLHNDYSEREFQLERSGQWVKGKSCDTFGPLGPYLVTPDEIPDINHLRLWLKVNGQTMQDSETSFLVFKVPFLISYISSFVTLLPGDVISTGTPAGVGLGRHPPVYLKPGDVIELGIDGLGTQRQRAT